MSIQEQPVRYNTPERKSSSSIVINRGNEEYDPFAIDDDDDNNNKEIEQLKNAKHQKQDSIRINNGTATNPVINNTNASSNSDKSSSLQTNESQQSRRKSKSPVEHNNNHSDHRSKSPHRNNYSSDRKRLHSSSPNSSIITTVNNNESSSNIDIISSSKHKESYRNDERKKSKHHHKHRSSSMSSSSKSSSSPSTSNNHKKTFDSKDEKSSNSSHNKSTCRSEKRDDYHSYRSRNYHSYASSKYSSRDCSSSTHQSNIDRRTTNSNFSSPPRLPSKIITTDGNSSLHNTESNQHETSTEDRNRIYNRLKNMNDTNTPVIPINNTNKISSSGPSFINTNGGSQRSRSNLIQIVTTETASGLTHLSTEVPPVRLSSSQVQPEAVKPLPVPSIPAKVESKTNTNDSIQSTITSKTNGNTADDMLMEEMLLEEEQEQSPVKSIDLDNLTIPETSTEKTDNKEESMKVITITTTAAVTTTTTTTTVTAAATTTTSTITSVPSLTPSPTKKPYTLYKVPHTNHMTPPLSSRHKKQTKKESSTTQPDSTTTNKSSTDDNLRRTSLDERISNLLSAPPTTSSNKSLNSSTEQSQQQQQQIDNRTNPTTIISTPSDKSTESPQDIPSLISTMVKKGQDHSSLTKKLTTNDERRSTTSKHYTTEWLASQKPEEAPTEDLIILPSLVTLPTLVSSQPSTITNTKPPTSNSGEAVMLGKLSEAMSKLIQKQDDTSLPTTTATETDDTVPISAKHLERIERRKQREKRQSEIAAIAKEALKPAFKRHDITKDEYKEIMKKVVTKATHANEVDRIRISKMIDAYVQKYRTIRHQNISKTSNGHPS
ncbi:unnamed protein product [Rotaria sp. Silwood2]|nr:unnamed protein product [Rotaria sp. Silwood2]